MVNYESGPVVIHVDQFLSFMRFSVVFFVLPALAFIAAALYYLVVGDSLHPVMIIPIILALIFSLITSVNYILLNRTVTVEIDETAVVVFKIRTGICRFKLTDLTLHKVASKTMSGFFLTQGGVKAVLWKHEFSASQWRLIEEALKHICVSDDSLYDRLGLYLIRF